MATATPKQKEARAAGMQRAEREMSAAQRVRRELMNGRPPLGDLKTPSEAIFAARVLRKEIESLISRVMPSHKASKARVEVSIGFISPDLNTLGFSPFYETDKEDELLGHLAGQVMLGLIFGTRDGGEIVTGVRPFLATKKTADWLEQLEPLIGYEMENP